MQPRVCTPCPWLEREPSLIKAERSVWGSDTWDKTVFPLLSHHSKLTGPDVFSPSNNPTASSVAFTDWLYIGAFCHRKSTASERSPQDCRHPGTFWKGSLRNLKKWEARVPMVQEEGLWFLWPAMGGKRNRQKRKGPGENETAFWANVPQVHGLRRTVVLAPHENVKVRVSSSGSHVWKPQHSS